MDAFAGMCMFRVLVCDVAGRAVVSAGLEIGLFTGHRENTKGRREPPTLLIAPGVDRLLL